LAVESVLDETMGRRRSFWTARSARLERNLLRYRYEHCRFAPALAPAPAPAEPPRR